MGSSVLDLWLGAPEWLEGYAVPVMDETQAMAQYLYSINRTLIAGSQVPSTDSLMAETLVGVGLQRRLLLPSLGRSHPFPQFVCYVCWGRRRQKGRRICCCICQIANCCILSRL